MYALAEIERGFVPARRLAAPFYGSWRVRPEGGRFVPLAPWLLIGEWTMPGPCYRVLRRKVLPYLVLPESKQILERKRRCPHPEGCCC